MFNYYSQFHYCGNNKKFEELFSNFDEENQDLYMDSELKDYSNAPMYDDFDYDDYEPFDYE